MRKPSITILLAQTFLPIPLPLPKGKGANFLFSFAGRLRPLHPVSDLNVLQEAVKLQKIFAPCGGAKRFASSLEICGDCSASCDAIASFADIHDLSQNFLNPQKQRSPDSKFTKTHCPRTLFLFFSKISDHLAGIKTSPGGTSPRRKPIASCASQASICSMVNASSTSPTFMSLKRSKPIPHSKPCATSLASSLKRLREAILSSNTTTPSRSTRI